MASEEAEAHKEKGNAAFKEKKFDEAVKHYNKAINLDPSNAAYYSNRSGAWSSKGSHDSALNDAEKCLQIDPGFVKGYSRKGKALFDMQRWDEAETAYQEGLAKDPSNAGCKQGVADVGNAKLAREAAARSRSQSSGGGIFGNIKNMVSQPSKLLKRVGKGGRLQMYIVVLASWYGYQYFVGGRGKSGKTAKEKAAVQGHEEAEEDEEPVLQAHTPPDAAAVAMERGFVEADGSWLGFVRAEGRKHNPLLLLLHRTSLSAETEYGPAFARLAKAGPSGGLSVLAPDRPCHGYSPCPPGGEPRNATAWLNKLIATAIDASVPRSVAVVAAGREARRGAGVAPEPPRRGAPAQRARAAQRGWAGRVAAGPPGRHIGGRGG
ncbi:unnamed protein product [Prorocentrum cordatum]|uniref:Uncharacterized protein n=1 Tax=Prorocentrum cordatum TaxID=2364126 RepID=A0ABN9RJE0_9DINO|nr:unnamed protein product [Polarella glacialis]